MGAYVVDVERRDRAEVSKRRVSIARVDWESPRDQRTAASDVRAAVWSEDFDWLGDRV